MNTPSNTANAWIYLAEDDPSGSVYTTHGSSYQSLITHGVYKYVDFLSLCWCHIVPTSSTTFPVGNGSTYTIEIENKLHKGSNSQDFSNQQYMDWVIQDARAANPAIKILIMLGYGTTEITQLFSHNSSLTAFADNLVAYLQHYGLDGFDVDWESPLSNAGTASQFSQFFQAIRAAFDAQSQAYSLTISPDMFGTADGATLASAFDYITLQMYDGFTCPDEFISKGVPQSLLMYGAKFETNYGIPYQTAQQAYAGSVQQACNSTTCTSNITVWRLNSGDFGYEQAQQMILFQLVHGLPTGPFDDSPIIGAADNPLISQLVVRSGEVIDSLQATNAGTLADTAKASVTYALLPHGGDGGQESTVTLAAGDAITEISGYTGFWFGWECVLQLTVTTRDGNTYGPFGAMTHAVGATPFAYTAPTGQTIVAFRGTTVTVPMAGGGMQDILASLDVKFA